MTSFISLSDQQDASPWLDVDYARLYQFAEQHQAAHIDNHPYAYSMMDGLFSSDLLRLVSDEAEVSFKETEKYFYGSVGKHASARRAHWGPVTRALLSELTSAEFLVFLEKLTGIEGLICDPYFEGGGIHQTQKDGFLKVHTDFNYHKKLKLDRRINLLLYLNENWSEEFGGHLELWDENMQSCCAKVLPISNRVVIFNTTDFSYHGHPEPLTCPAGRSRKSLAIYYYTNGRPSDEIKFEHRVSTNYQERPAEKFDKKLKMPLIKKLKKKLINRDAHKA